MSRPYQIRFVGGAAGVSHADLSATLLRLLKGDEAKVDEMLDTPGMVMARCATEAEAAALQNRLRGFGIECRIDYEQPAASAIDSTSITIKETVVCPHCGVQQDAGETCRQCGNPLNATVALLYSAKARQKALEAQAEAEAETHAQAEAERRAKGNDGRSWNLRFIAGVFLVIVVGGYATLREELPAWMGGGGNGGATGEGGEVASNASGKKDSASMQILKGIFSSPPKSDQPVYKYDPESGDNPYQKQLERLGVDTDELAKAQGFEGGIRMDQFNEAVGKSGVGGAIGDLSGDRVVREQINRHTPAEDDQQR